MSLFENILNPVGAVIDTVGSIFNNERNIDFQKENLAYQRDLQQQIFNREDTAVLRRVKDLKAAGMNPLLAAGGAASSGAAVQTTAPRSDNPDLDFMGKMLSMSRQQTDISMTKAQQELVNEQRKGVELNNELTQRTIDWYKNHPSYAPGVDSGITTGKGISTILDDVLPDGTVDFLRNHFKKGFLGLSKEAYRYISNRLNL